MDQLLGCALTFIFGIVVYPLGWLLLTWRKVRIKIEEWLSKLFGRSE